MLVCQHCHEDDSTSRYEAPLCSYEDTKKSRDANSCLRMALEFLPYETIVPIGVGTGASRQKGVYDLSLVFSVLGEEMIEVLEANLGAG